MSKAENEYLKAFRGDEVADVENDPAVDEVAAEGPNETPGDAVVLDPVEAAAGDDAPVEPSDVAIEQIEGEGDAEAAGETDLMVNAEQAEGGEGEEAMSPEDIQRQKSWEGRLRKREEELAAREAAMGAEGSDDEEIANIKQALSDDFGEDFVAMIVKLAANESKKFAEGQIKNAVSPLEQTVSAAIAEVQEAFANLHFGRIAEAHEDFKEIIESPEFGQYVETLEGDAKDQAVSALESGSSQQVIKVLSGYKDYLKANSATQDEDLDDAMDAMGGVKGSSPVSLPDRPSANDQDEYKSAWASL